MSKIVEKNVAEIILIVIIAIALFGMSSCGSASYSTNPAYEGWAAGCGK